MHPYRHLPPDFSADAMHGRYGPEARYAVAAEEQLPTTKWEAEVARGLELGLPGADSINDKRIPTFSRGELPHFAGINTFLKAPYIEDVRTCADYDIAIFGAPFDGGTTYRPGTRFGPQGIRRISAPDTVLMRVTDGFLALPAPVVAIAVVAALGGGFVHTLIAVALVWWPFYARIVRGEIRSLAARPHVEAARLAGAGRLRIAVWHLLPGAVPAVVITASLDVGNLVLTLAALSFLGLGQPQPAPELGADTAHNLTYLLQQWWIPVMPGIAVLLLALAANIGGDGVRNLLGDQ